MITHKMVERAGCIVCPACLRETPTKFSICLRCKGMMMSHGRRPVEIKIEDESEDEDEMEVDESIGVEPEPTEDQKEEYKDAVDEGQQAADTADAHGFSEEEVDYGGGEDEEDVEMEADEGEEEEQPDEGPEVQDENEKKRAEYEAHLDKFPKWSHPLEVGIKTMPIENLINVDSDEGGARIFDNVVLNYIIMFMENYYKIRVHEDPEQYHKDMVGNKKGRIDLDGLCLYNPSLGDELEPPTLAQLRAFWDTKASPDPKAGDIRSWASRELNDMPTVVDVATKLEKVMAFLVEAGFTHEKLVDFKPTKEDQLDRTRRVRMQLVIRNFLQRALKGAYPDMESYTYFRGTDEHGGTCLSLPALGVILATRMNKRPMEASICANQSGVTSNGLRHCVCQEKRGTRGQIRYGQIDAKFDCNRTRHCS